MTVTSSRTAFGNVPDDENLQPGPSVGDLVLHATTVLATLVPM